MVFKKFIEGLEANWSRLGFEYETEENKVSVKGQISSQTYDDDIFVDATLYESGNMCLTLVFDQIEPTKEVYDLINAFNDNVGYLKGYISERNEKTFFAIDYYVRINTSEEQAVDEFEYALWKIAQDQTSKYLLPITELTHE